MAHLKVTPDKTIEFPIVLYTSIPTAVKLENISETMQCIAFKVKTTAPKKYLVRPSTGTIRHNEECEIQITLQPLTEVVESCGDRFLIQYCLVENEEPLPRDFWTSIDKSLVFDKRLSVAFKKIKDAADHLSSNASNINRVSENNQKHLGTAATCDSANEVVGMNIQVNSTPDFASSAGGLTGTNSGSSVSPLNQNDISIKQMYDELVKYCLAVEKQKNCLQKENESLKKKLQEVTTPQTRSYSFFDICYIVPLLLGAFILAKLFGFL